MNVMQITYAFLFIKVYQENNPFWSVLETGWVHFGYILQHPTLKVTAMAFLVLYQELQRKRDVFQEGHLFSKVVLYDP